MQHYEYRLNVYFDGFNAFNTNFRPFYYIFLYDKLIHYLTIMEIEVSILFGRIWRHHCTCFFKSQIEIWSRQIDEKTFEIYIQAWLNIIER